MLRKAKQFASKEMLAKAQAIETAACDKIDYFNQNGRF